MYEIINRFYTRKIYKKEDVAIFVASGDITPAEYERITGEEHPA